jgi:hypothetical protein
MIIQNPDNFLTYPPIMAVRATIGTDRTTWDAGAAALHFACVPTDTFPFPSTDMALRAAVGTLQIDAQAVHEILVNAWGEITVGQGTFVYTRASMLSVQIRRLQGFFLLFNIQREAATRLLVADATRLHLELLACVHALKGVKGAIAAQRKEQAKAIKAAPLLIAMQGAVIDAQNASKDLLGTVTRHVNKLIQI